jgi:hypothetical protein
LSARRCGGELWRWKRVFERSPLRRRALLLRPRPLKPWVPLDEVQGTDDASRRLPPPLARVGRIRSLTEARRRRGRERRGARSSTCLTRRASEPKERRSSPCLRASVRELLIESSTPTEAEIMSARQTEAERSSDAVCGTVDVGVDSDGCRSADSVCGHSWLADSDKRDPRSGVRNHECPSDEVRTKFGRSLRNG